MFSSVTWELAFMCMVPSSTSDPGCRARMLKYLAAAAAGCQRVGNTMSGAVVVREVVVRQGRLLW